MTDAERITQLELDVDELKRTIRQQNNALLNLMDSKLASSDNLTVEARMQIRAAMNHLQAAQGRRIS